MQFSLKIPSDSHHFPLSWNSQFTIQNPISKISQKPFPKILTLTNSLKTSFNYESEEVEKGSEPAIMARLPVVIRRPGKVFRYFWDGNSLQLIRVDQGNSRDCIGLDDGFGKFFEFCNLGVRNFFVPQRVNENYMDYVKWKFLHRVFSSALQVLATQAMFRAIGIGYSRSLPSAAALNWVLKDGLGR